jgi:EF hand
MGEPFRPSGHDDDTLVDWFRQADRNHDGQLTIEEAQQDAERFFATLDVNHDGEIDPDEINRYEEVVAPEVRTGAGFEVAARGNNDHQGGARFGLLDLPEPVVSADTNFNRGVSLAEFRTAAERRFLALDVDHKGLLTLSGLITLRPAPPTAPHEAVPSADPQSAAPNPAG